MQLVHEKKDKSKTWEVAWTWLPYFLSADKDLHRFVDQKMTEEFSGIALCGTLDGPPETRESFITKMHLRVVDLILEKHPIPGLRRLLDAYVYVRPEEAPDGVAA